MKRSEAVELIRAAKIEKTVQYWYDLGAGSGIFTLALAEFLAPQSIIWAVDRNRTALEHIPEQHQGVEIRRVTAQLDSEGFDLPAADGAVMANLLHFIPNTQQFLEKVLRICTRALVVEYEHSRPSIWQPFPVPISTLRAYLQIAGNFRLAKIGSRRSRFGGEMYAALIEHRGH